MLRDDGVSIWVPLAWYITFVLYGIAIVCWIAE